MEIRIVQHKNKLPLINFDHIVKGSGCGGVDDMKKRHSVLLPDTVRCIVCGPSNCGKTNAVFNMLFAENGLRFDNLYVFSKSLYQPKYKFLNDIMQQVPEVGYFAYDENEQVIQPSDAEPNSVIIFDDVACEKQNNIRSYFAMGRHNNLDCFYLCQTYSRIPKQLVRDNANLLLLFRQDERNLRHVYNDHVNTDMTYDNFTQLCRKAWGDGNKHGFLLINKECDIDKGRYRVGFDQFIQLNSHD